jgi:hypothetical protein
MFTKLFSIAGNAFTETVRQPVYGVVLLLTVLLLIFCNVISGWTLEDDNMLMKEFGLSTLLMSNLVLAAFSAAGILAREIDNHTALTVISKPIGRPMFIVGKYLGLAAALAVAYYLTTIAFLIVVRHRVMEAVSDPYDVPALAFGFGALFLIFFVGGFCNFFYGMHFQSLAVRLAVVLFTMVALALCIIDREWKLQTFGKEFLDLRLMVAIFLIFVSVMVLTAVALAASTRLGPAMTLVVVLGVAAVGMISDYVFGGGSAKADTAAAAAVLNGAYHVIPNIGFFWLADVVVELRDVALGYFLLSVLYGVLWVVAFLGIAVALFQKRELG